MNGGREAERHEKKQWQIRVVWESLTVILRAVGARSMALVSAWLALLNDSDFVINRGRKEYGSWISAHSLFFLQATLDSGGEGRAMAFGKRRERVNETVSPGAHV